MRSASVTTTRESLADENKVLSESEEDSESLWRKEILRRDAELMNGKAVVKPAEQVLCEVRELLRKT